MTQTEQNMARLAAACRGDKKQFAAICATAKKLKLQNPKRKATPQSAATARLQNYVRGIPPQDLKNAIGKFGVTSVHNKINCASILETAVQKFAEQAIRKASR
ncbi:MAG: hypothetical protein JJD98_02040 [Polaromonas sp.]|nr:hypothetical protein [Polaromonas sp.]